MVVRISVGKRTIIFDVFTEGWYALMDEQELFYEDKGDCMGRCKSGDVILVCGDLNGHVGMDTFKLQTDKFEGVHGKKRYNECGGFIIGDCTGQGIDSGKYMVQ